MKGMKVALGNRGMTGETAGQCEKERKSGGHCTNVIELVSCGYCCLALCSFGLPSHALVVIAWRGVACHYMMQFG